VATVLELARHSNVAPEQVLRVINGEPVSSDVASRVRASIETLGPPPHPSAAGDVSPPPASETREAWENHVETSGRSSSQPDEDVARGVESLVYEALRVEVRPVAEHVSEMGHLVDELVEGIAALRADTSLQRRERLEDLQLLTELVTSGWRSVDRRLGRLERMVERLQPPTNGSAARPALPRDATR
jgi:hypothetical protein